MDATFILDNRSNRGTGGDFEYRYILSKNSEGNVKFSIFDQNKLEPKTQRWLLKAYHKERFSDKSYGRIDINLVGDKEYFRDFTSDVDTRTSRYLNSSIYYSKNWDKYSLTSEFKFHKNLIVGDKTTLQILPTINFTGLRQNLFDTPLFYSLDSSFTNFWRDEGVRGQRIDIYPRFSLPLSPGGYFQFTPEVGIRETIYKSSNEVSRINSREIVDLNTTIDTSFERVFFIEKFGIKKLLHSIEPELSYTFIPKVNQKDFPFFDGIDRISNNNLLTYSLTNRILGKFTDEEGMDYTLELLKFRLSQSFDINEERRERISPEDKKRPLSNLRAELSIKPSKYVNIGMNTNYDVYEKETRSLNSLLKIRDKRDDLFQFGYRYNKGAIEEYNTTLDLKVTDYIRAYYESRYSNRDSLWLESKYGVEYKSLCDCWSLRFSFGERVRPSEREFSFLLNLTGLGYIGRRSTFGYK
jgi:LPS-assembly protein